MGILVLRWASGALALYLTSRIIKGINFKNTTTMFISVAVIAFLNILVRPILFLLTLPFTMVTFGLFIFILNGLIFLLASSLVDGFDIQTFGDAILGWVIFSFISLMLNTWLIPSSVIVINSF